MVNLLDPSKTLIDGIFSRDDCLKTKRGYFIKDLNIFKNRNLKDILIVDDCITSFALNLDNGIPIMRWENKKNDKELKFLMEFLVQISSEKDVRESIKSRFDLEKLASKPFDDLQEGVNLMWETQSN